MKRIFRKALSLLIAAGLCAGSVSALAQPSETDCSVSEEAAEDSFEDYSGSMVFMQEGMRAVNVTAGVDFAKNTEMSFEEVQEELAELFAEIAGYGMNAVFIDVSKDTETGYDPSLFCDDILKSALNAAHDAGLYAYVKLNVGELVDDVCAGGGGLKEGFSAAAHRYVMNYPCEGILLSDYYTRDSARMYGEYMRSGSGIGYTNWLYETNEYIVRTLSEVIRRTNNTVAVGLLISDMWANSTTEGGSETADTVQALYDGFCDTKKYTEKGYADFLLVQTYGSTADTALNFAKVVDWWYQLAQDSGTKLYVLHMNEKIGQYTGWYEDQLLRQLTVLEDYTELGGSAFNSLTALRANTLGSTDTLLKYFSDQINTDTIFEDLTMISPASLSFVTYDATVKFMGTFDENFDVYFDGSKIKLNEAGNFYFQKDLKVGRNSFKIEHKGKTYTYSIERRVDVLKSIEQEKDIVVEGGTKIALVAVAYSGSSVTATIGGTTVRLKEKSGSGEELDANSSYAKFVGYYRVGEGIIGEEQYLGNISFHAKYSGIEEYMTGGSVTIEAEPEPPKQEIIVDMLPDQSAAGSGEVVGTMPPVVSAEETATYVKVLNNYTTVYDSRTTGGIPSPVFSQLPAGTLDYYKSSYDGYITTTSGKRFEAADVTTFSDTGLGYNSLVVKAIGNAGGKSFIKLHMDYKSSFNITTPVTFHEDLDGAYGVSDYNASTVYITFDNITSVTSLPSFSYCSLFSGGTWDTVEENGVQKFRLVLTLRQAGIYSGCGAYYDENGDLMLTFAVPTASLAGKTIVIDPGHGYGKTAEKLDPGAIGNVTEQSVNLAVSKVLEKKLTEMGANVVRLKTESEFILTTTRPAVARAYGADMYISLHCNSAVNTNAHGVEVYYFTPFSQPLASAINSRLSSYYDTGVYADGTDSNRGAKYSYYWVTLQQDFPSVLVEMGFISNERECMVMATPKYQEGMADAIANGVYAFFARSGLTYSGNGSDVAEVQPSPGDIPIDPAETEPSDPTEENNTPETAETPVQPEQPEPEQPTDNPETAEPPEPPNETTDNTSEAPAETSENPAEDVGVDSGSGGIRVE